MLMVVHNLIYNKKSSNYENIKNFKKLYSKGSICKNELKWDFLQLHYLMNKIIKIYVEKQENSNF